jgi:hypothetical protein
MNLTELLSNTLAVSILSLLAGALITAIATKIHSKTAIFRYFTRIERVALAADDLVRGRSAGGLQNLVAAVKFGPTDVLVVLTVYADQYPCRK